MILAVFHSGCSVFLAELAIESGLAIGVDLRRNPFAVKGNL